MTATFGGGGEGTYVTCDGRCRTSVSMEDVDAETFQELIDSLKDDGWWVAQVDGTWYHVCPDDAAEGPTG